MKPLQLFFLIAGVSVLLLTKTPQAIMEGVHTMLLRERVAKYKPIVDRWCDEYGLGLELRPLVYGLVEQESDWQPEVFRDEPQLKPPDRSRGLMQILLRTAQGVGFAGNPDELYDPNINVQYALKFLISQWKRYDWNLEAGIEAYNRGSRYNDPNTPWDDTSAYAASVMAKSKHYLT